jgi:hypothetical protein
MKLTTQSKDIDVQKFEENVGGNQFELDYVGEIDESA